MKTKEFIKRVKELGYKITENSAYIFVDKKWETLAIISKEKQYKIEIFNILGEACADELYNICFEYARTPIDERGEEKKFYLQKMKSFYDNIYNERGAFLNLDIPKNVFRTSTMNENYVFKTKFTQKEIDKIKEEQHTDLSEFKQIPVEEVEE